MRLSSPLSLADGLRNALTDPQRRERTLALTLIGFAASWTLYGLIARGSQGIHFDMAELADLARHPAFGDNKNPPFAIWVTAAWFALFPRVDWAFYLLAMMSVAVGLWAAWRLYARLLTPDKQVLALAIVGFVPLLTFHALKFNNNVLMIPLWALTMLWFVRSYEDRRPLYAALAGLAAAAAMMTKYWSVFLIVGLAVAALCDRRRDAYFRSPAPWITATCGTLALVPHLLWLTANHFPSFSYAMAVHGGRGYEGTILSVINYLGGAFAYCAAPLLIVLVATRPSRAVLRDMLLPPDGPRRFIAGAFWTMLLAPVPVAFLAATEIVSLWVMPVAPLMPLVLLSPPALAVTREALRRVIVLAVAFPIVCVLSAPGIGLFIHGSRTDRASYYQPVAQVAERMWRSVSGRPMGFVAGEGDLAYGVAFYLPWPVTAFPDFNRTAAPWVDNAGMARGGAALVCPAEDEGCVTRIKAYAANAARFQIDELTLTPRFLGVDGAPRRFVVIVVPPQNALAALP